jgi:6-phosphogluconolactonase (cycloisomerase 2 family)
MVVVRDDLVTVVDLGLDALRSYRLNADGRLNPHSISRLHPGTGPRQLVHQPGTRKAIVLGELADTLTVVAETEHGTFTEIGTVPASAPAGPNQAAHLLVSTDGSWAMASNRGPDSIALFSLSSDLPRLVEEYPVGPRWPRHFGIVGHHLYVGNQHADRLLTFTLDITSGRLTRQGGIATGTPACVISRPTSDLDEASRPEERESERS